MQGLNGTLDDQNAHPMVVVIDHNDVDAGQLIDGMAECSDARFVHYAEAQAALVDLKTYQPDIILADIYTLTDCFADLNAAMARFNRICPGTLVLVLSDGQSVSGAVAALQAGAHDFLSKPIEPGILASRIAELGHRHGKASALAMERVSKPSLSAMGGFVGNSPQMQAVYDQIKRVASSDAPVFITGESGTGKDVCASALHAAGSRSDKPFVVINCGAIPRELMELELFGASKGAYSGAHADRNGAVQHAEGGILFLDEIGELELGLQAKLLRFLQTGTFNRIGDPAMRRADVRVICATNRNPMQLIAEKAFREDLFYRLHVLPIHLPPLRQRPTDIVPLAENFLAAYAREEGKQFMGFTAQVRDHLVARDWPGNVRQLQNVIRRIVVMFDGTEIDASMLGAAEFDHRSEPIDMSGRNQHKSAAILPMWQEERRIIERAMNLHNGNISQAAAALEISPSTIYRKRQQWDELEAAQSQPAVTGIVDGLAMVGAA